MGKATSIGNLLAWPLLLPGNIACDALRLGEHQNLVRMPVNSLIGRYKGNPVVKHLVIPGTKPQLLERWLALFEATSRELFGDTTREAFRIKAERIAEGLKLALFYRPDRPWPPEPSP
jgi:hypothetical protein